MNDYLVNLAYIHYNLDENSGLSYEWLRGNLTVAESECTIQERALAMEFSLIEKDMRSKGFDWNEGDVTDYESAMHEFLYFGKRKFV